MPLALCGLSLRLCAFAGDFPFLNSACHSPALDERSFAPDERNMENVERGSAPDERSLENVERRIARGERDVALDGRDAALKYL